MLSLREVVERYVSLAGNFGKPLALSAFGWSARETGKFFCSFDEDYQVSRYLHFSRGDGETYTISGEQVTHVAIDAEIRTLL